MAKGFDRLLEMMPQMYFSIFSRCFSAIKCWRPLTAKTICTKIWVYVLAITFVLCRPYRAGMNDMFCIYKGFVARGTGHESVSTRSAIKHSVLPRKPSIIAFGSLVLFLSSRGA